MTPDPELLEMLELLQQYMTQRGYVICELPTVPGTTLELSDNSLADFYTDWLASAIETRTFGPLL